jgi:hypothetical protein
MGRLIGVIGCRGIDCSERVGINETAGGNLTMKCQICKFSTYAPPGSRSARLIRSGMTAIEDDATVTGMAGPLDSGRSSPAGEPQPLPTKRKNSVFDMGEL